MLFKFFHYSQLLPLPLLTFALPWGKWFCVNSKTYFLWLGVFMVLNICFGVSQTELNTEGLSTLGEVTTVTQEGVNQKETCITVGESNKQFFLFRSNSKILLHNWWYHGYWGCHLASGLTRGQHLQNRAQVITSEWLLSWHSNINCLMDQYKHSRSSSECVRREI